MSYITELQNNLDNIVEYMNASGANEMSKEEYFEQGDTDIDRQMYDFVWSLYFMHKDNVRSGE